MYTYTAYHQCMVCVCVCVRVIDGTRWMCVFTLVCGIGGGVEKGERRVYIYRYIGRWTIYQRPLKVHGVSSIHRRMCRLAFVQGQGRLVAERMLEKVYMLGHWKTQWQGHIREGGQPMRIGFYAIGCMYMRGHDACGWMCMCTHMCTRTLMRTWSLGFSWYTSLVRG